MYISYGAIVWQSKNDQLCKSKLIYLDLCLCNERRTVAAFCRQIFLGSLAIMKLICAYCTLTDCYQEVIVDDCACMTIVTSLLPLHVNLLEGSSLLKTFS